MVRAAGARGVAPDRDGDMSAFYNEFDPFAAAWLRELIKEGAIADGEVSESDMWDVVPSELVRFNQVHLCAGIGGWSHALRLAGWPDDQPVWTVSLPCQPFSTAGKGSGLADARGQLAEAFFWLAGVCRPGIIFGEQVEAAIRHDWLDVVASSLESIGYTVGAVAFPASSVGALHGRQRIYWVAYTESKRLSTYMLETSEINIKRHHTFSEKWWGEELNRLCGSMVDENVWRQITKTTPDPQPCVRTLAYGHTNRVGIIRGAGNAIVPQAAAEFIRAAMEVMDE